MSQVQLESAESRGGSAPVLEVNGLSVWFRKRHGLLGQTRTIIRAVDNVSFSVFKSEVMSIVGESGSGKTTVARCILGLTRPTKGSIKFGDVEVTKLTGKSLSNYRRSVQLVYQDPYESLNPRHDVLTTLSLPLRNLLGMTSSSKIYDIASSLLEEVDLNPEETLHRYPHQLSGGQRQRVNIARALAPGPKILVADEPITMLDAAQRLNILSMLTNLKNKRDLTVLMITHDLASARLISERTIVMYLGKLVEIGETKLILSDPSHPYVRRVLSATPTLKKEWIASGPIHWIEESDAVKTGCIYYPRCPNALEICRQSEPELVKTPKTNYVACHNPAKT
jgi:peptide/nickel transport system ATP-binding protein